MVFPCTGCGLCCRRVGFTIEIAKTLIEQSNNNANSYLIEISEFPHKTKADGSCEHLQEDNSCAIYLTRPDICDVNKTWEKHHAEKLITKKDYFVQTAHACNAMIDRAHYPKKFKIDPETIVYDIFDAPKIITDEDEYRIGF